MPPARALDITEEQALWFRARCGRIVATWSQEAKRGRLDVTVTPSSGWRASKHASPVRREARAVAKHAGLEAGEVRVEG